MDSVIYRLTVFGMCKSLSLILPIRIAWLIIFHTTVDEISLFKVVFAVTVALFEVPTGIMADLVSRRLSMAISAILFALHSLAYILFPSFWGFLATQVLLGLSATFVSGADTAYLHSYLSKKTDANYSAVSGKMELISKCGSAIFSLLSSIIFAISPNLIFTISATGGLIGFFIALSLPENNENGMAIKQLRFKHFKRNLKNGIALLLDNKEIRKITIVTAFVSSFLIFNFEMYQVKFNLIGIPSTWNGPIYAAFMLMMGFGAKSARNLLKQFSHFSTIILLTFAVSLSFLFFSYSPQFALVAIAIVLQQLAFGCWDIVVTNFLLDNCPQEDAKSTLASMNSLVVNLLKSFIVGGLGILASASSLGLVYLFMGITLPLVVLSLVHTKQ